MMHGQSFLKAFVKGLTSVVGGAIAYLFLLQIVYGLGWYLYSVLPKYEQHVKADVFTGMTRVVLADPPTPQTAWLFASGSMPSLLLLGLLLLFFVAFVAYLGLCLASIGGWQAPSRIRAMLD